MQLLDKKHLPQDFVYPADFIRIVDQNLINLDPWTIMFDENLKKRYEGIKLRYPNRNLIPFATRMDNDDVACFNANNSGEINVVHDFAKEGWEKRQDFNSFWDWFKKAVDDMIKYEP